MSETLGITLHVISDSLGETGESVARAVASQFPQSQILIRRTTMLRNVDELTRIVTPHLGDPRYLFVYTFVRGELHRAMEQFCHGGAVGVDVLGATIARVEHLTGEQPTNSAGAMHRTDASYFERIDAMEFSVAHDDGMRPEDLGFADIVLLGVSRSSKTPLSIYLAYRGFKTANVPLTPGTEPPAQLAQVDRSRMYGLTTTADVLLKVRAARMRELGTYVPEYTEREAVEHELDEARRVMRTYQCIVVNTANRAIEEVAQEILRFQCAH